jgi:acylphosphatase
MRIARHLRVRGLVQGVCFRAWTRQEARALDVAGWVRNCPDGSVEAQLEGEEAAVDELIERLRHGPAHARVDEVEVGNCPARELTGFEVRH